MVKRRDIAVVAIALLLALALWGARALWGLGQEAGATVLVYVAGTLHTSAPLRAGEIITVTQADGSRNVIRMTADGFYMEESTCRNQLCVRGGAVSRDNWPTRALGRHIICLPNRVDVALALTDEARLPPPDPDAPDV